MIAKREIVIDTWVASCFDNVYDGKKLKGAANRVKQISTDQFIHKIKNIQKGSSIFKDVLPPNCRYTADINGNKLFIIEEPPQMRTIFLNHDMSMTVASLKSSGDLKKFGYEKWFKDNKKPYNFYLAFPYIIYMIVLDPTNNFRTLKIFSRVTPLSSLGDYLCKIPLMNVNKDQAVCMGNLNRDYSTSTPTSAIESVIKSFWSNIFNKDYIYNVQAYNDIPFVCDYLTWQYYSKVDPMFIYNVEWIPFKDVNTEISKLRRGFSRCDEDQMALSTFVNKIFYQATPTQLKDKKTKLRIYDDVADSINIDRIPIFINDSFMLKNKRYFVSSFMSPKGTPSLTHIKLQDTDKNIKIYRLTKLFQSKLRKCIIQERFIQSTTLPDGTVVKQGSIIKSTSVHGHDVYNKIIYMRYGLDGKIEARIKSSLTALEDMKNIKVIDLKKLEVNGIVLKKDKLYNLSFKNDGSSTPIKLFKKLQLIDIDVSTIGKVMIKFEETNISKTHSIKLEDLNNRIIDEKKIKKIPHICRLGTSMITNPNISIHSDKKDCLFLDNFDIHIPNYNDTMEIILKDKNHLFIESFDMNLSFKVGDKVVTSNWAEPTEMLKVKTVTGFATRNDYDLNVLLVDQHGNETEHTYIHKTMENFTVNVGTLRHIEKEYNGITSGVKIKANRSKISNFPMKNTNIIIGFLTDTGGDIPLVLCSNGATLWADELENFNLITMSNKKWKSLKHAPIINQRVFKYQPGDMTTIPYSHNPNIQNLITIQYRREKLVCQYLTGSGALYPAYMGYFKPEMKSMVNRIGFLNPRYSLNQLQEQKLLTAYPNFHGMYNYNPNIRMKYYIDERRIVNVSDLPV